ncbi:Mu transposase C-terminal domain-containing protein [Mesorhizobium kowhaii]|uniref:Mu transposase C-terminal domain-containing protein n=1 Tax=Mesorhizobium kowhaii TaxID=1300272 RepID=UPI0035EA896A
MNPALARSHERCHLFGRHDRLVIDGQSFRVERKVRDSHVLQPVTGELIAEDFFVVKTDKEINGLIRSKRMRIDEGYYSKALGILRVRFDDSNLSDLSEEDLRTVGWKKEWCVRFLDAAANVEGRWRPRRTLDDCALFIEENAERMDRWYLDTFGERRRPGRRLPGEVRKAFDYPSAASLKKWMAQFVAGHCRMDSFRPRYSNSGNRNQLDARAAAVIAVEVQKYASILKPKMADICENVELALHEINKRLPEHQHIYASDNAVRRRIHALDPFMVDAGREDSDYALRKYTPVGKGLSITTALGRVEMDDWEVDLHTLIMRSSIWKALKPEQQKLVPRVRMTFTAGIDCASRCIVGFNLSINSPSTATTKPALRSVMVDKTELAAAAGAKASWHMHGRPTYVATDGGPAYRSEFDDAAMRVNVGRVVPEQDPRMRGTVEAFFRYMKRLCRYFAGRAFANVVERRDYPAEQLAALTVGEFYKTLIVFIVDYYHLRPHRGLEGRTPYGKWMELEQAGLPPAPSEQQLAVAFGLRRKERTISKHGVEFLGISYNSLELTRLYALLGQKKVDVIIEPEDLGCVFVRIPKQFRGRIKGVPEDQDFLTVSSVDGTGKGKMLAETLLAKRAVREFVKAEQQAGRTIRIDAHRHFLDLAEDVRKRAAIATHEITEKTLDLLEARVAFSGRAGLGSVQYAAEESDGDGLGKVVALSTRRRVDTNQKPHVSPVPQEEESAPKPKPFGGSMNLFDGEDE